MSYQLVIDPDSDNPYAKFKDIYDVKFEARYFGGFYTEPITKRLVFPQGFNVGTILKKNERFNLK